ncbi:MAG: tyrosine--tRNA ligase [Planctomycetota bacterium]
MGLYEEFEWRGMVQDATQGLRELLSCGKVAAYVGFDPTADSLHVGSLLPLTVLTRLQRFGHHVVAVVGGGTGMIGDPSGKSDERNLLNEEQIAANARGIQAQIARFLDFDRADNPGRMVNNLEWLGAFRMVDFLRDVGKNFTVNYMIAKESVKRRLGSEQGISYTEFSYLILQAYDFLALHDRHGVILQVGGSDQWGNITAGIDLIRSQRAKKAHGLVHPLVTSATGVKFGKTEEGTVWLDPKRTSPYRFYQFWMNTADSDVIQYLKFFSFLEEPEIQALEQAHLQAPHQRAAHRRLAEEVTRMVHGEEALGRAQRATEIFFGAELDDLDLGETLELFADVPSTSMSRDEFGSGVSIVDMLVATGVAKGRKDARRSIEGGGIYVNNRRVEDADARFSPEQAIGSELFVLRKGKKAYHLLRIE